jgi:hypothetical protein
MKKNIDINFGDLKNLPGKMAKNLRWVFFIIFLFMLVMEVFQVKKSYSIISNINEQPVIVGTGPEVRINFDNYNKVIARIGQAAGFQPTGGVAKNPFATQVVIQPTQ